MVILGHGNNELTGRIGIFSSIVGSGRSNAARAPISILGNWMLQPLRDNGSHLRVNPRGMVRNAGHPVVVAAIHFWSNPIDMVGTRRYVEE
jgi:hypothetical protein